MSSRYYKYFRKIQKLSKRVVILTLPFVFLYATGCAFKKVPGGSEPGDLRTESPKAGKIEPEARGLFFQAERLYFGKKYNEAVPVYQQVKNRFQKGRAHQLSSYRLGSIYYYQGNYNIAEKEFTYFLNRFQQSDLTFDVIYNLGATQYQQERYEKAYQTLSQLKPEEIQRQGQRRAETVFQLLGQTAGALGNHPQAIAHYTNQMQMTASEANRRNIEENIDGHLSKITSNQTLTQLLGVINEPSTKSKISAKLVALGAQSPVATEIIPSQNEVEEQKDLPLIGSSSGERFNIGVVLPLSGKFAPYGRKALDGILLASRVFSSQDQGVRLFVEDSASNPALAQGAIDKLVRNNSVIAVVGPLNVKESIAAAERSQEVGVLNLSLSPKEGIAEKGAYLFQNALTPRVQLQSLAEFAIKDKSLRRFAIIAPSNPFGKDMANAFWDAVESLGGKVVAFETYSPDEKDFQGSVRSLVGVNNPKYRPLEWKKLNEWAKEEKAKGKKEPKIKLEPLIDFDAIFIPDSPKTVGSIAANLAYYDVSGIPLLGTTEWNSPELYKRGGQHVEGSIFPGSVNAGTKNANQRDFIKAYTESMGNPPDLLATQSFEALQLIMYAIQKSGSNNRNDVVTELSRLDSFEGPLGPLSFQGTRVARRRVPIYTLESGGTIVEQ